MYSEERFQKVMKQYQKDNLCRVDEFCIQTGISERTFRRWTSGEAEPQLQAMLQIAQFFHISLDILFGVPLEAAA